MDLLIHRGVPEKTRPWYRRRVQAFLKSLRPVSLSRLTAEQATGWLQGVSSRSQLASRQFPQTIDALQLLFVDRSQGPAEKLSIGTGGRRTGARWRRTIRPSRGRRLPSSAANRVRGVPMRVNRCRATLARGAIRSAGHREVTRS
jgi:hypothetical protein